MDHVQAQRPADALRAGGRWRKVRHAALGLFFAGLVAVAAITAVHSRVSARSSSVVLETADHKHSVSAEVKAVLQHAQARQPMSPAQVLPEQVLAERDMKKAAWRGISDQVVREFDSVFTPHSKKGKKIKSKVAKIPLGSRHAVKGAKHETDKGNFLLKMGLVNKGGYVRVWVPDAPLKATKAAASATASSAAASRPGAVAEAASPLKQKIKTLQGARQTSLQQKLDVSAAKNGAKAAAALTAKAAKPCNPSLQLGCSDKTKAPAWGARAASNAAADISAAVATQSTLAAQWSRSEGMPQPVLPENAVLQTREAVADALSNVLLEAKQAENKFSKVQLNMQNLHSAISRVEGVVHSFHEAPARNDYAGNTHANMARAQERRSQWGQQLRMREVEEERRRHEGLQRREYSLLERRREIAQEREGSATQLALQDTKMQPAADDYDADELALWSAPAALRQARRLSYKSTRREENFDAITQSLARLNAKFAREATPAH